MKRWEGGKKTTLGLNNPVGHIGVHVLRHADKKPSGGEALTNHLQITPDQIAFVGDRILTDVMYGNLNGNLTIWTKQVISEKGDNAPAIWVKKKKSVAGKRMTKGANCN